MDGSDDDGIMGKLNSEKNKLLVFAKKGQLKDITKSEFGQKVSNESKVEDPIMDESSNQAENSPNLTSKTSTSNFPTDLFESKNASFIQTGREKGTSRNVLSALISHQGGIGSLNSCTSLKK